MLSTNSMQPDEIAQCLEVVNQYMISSTTDKHGIIHAVSNAFCEISGYSREELIGQPQSIIRHPDSSSETFEDLWKTIKAGKQWQGELKNRKKDGSSYWVITTIFPRFDKDGDIIGYISLRQDISSAKELLRQEEILKEQSKNAAMGEMIGLIAHQWMQPLSAISATAANAEVKMELNTLKQEDLRGIFTSIEKNIHYLSETINDFRNFFKNDNIRKKISIAEVLKYSISIIQPLIQENNITLIFNPAILDKHSNTQIGTVDKNDLVQVILNIIKNSTDALVDMQIEAPYIEINLREKDKTCTLEFSDNAGGIPEDNLNKIFDKNFSTKGNKGTGLGLYMSKMIIEKHLQGTIDVHNNGKGACFHIHLPMMD